MPDHLREQEGATTGGRIRHSVAYGEVWETGPNGERIVRKIPPKCLGCQQPVEECRRE